MIGRKIFLKIDFVRNVCCFLTFVCPLFLSLFLPGQIQKWHRSQLTLVNLNSSLVNLNSSLVSLNNAQDMLINLSTTVLG